MLTEEEIYERFHITEQEMDKLAEEAENDAFPLAPGAAIQLRPLTAKERDSLNRLCDMYRCEETVKAL
ncbi:hypothetical protein [Bifidobacterium sp. ESL0790]|uniref:hypothetical protein n=1 Tax=Bifidobacterium sp. ESL0790 TaxID=2983233 RepID=UPI0023F8F135|nr:hypothetical protein [Bifidobacterium sp. ESL0790]WEV72251.1 hypothetical protein OZY47_07420 [Bifidobacterium sp. ESL0790]